MIVDVEFLEHVHKIERKLAQQSALLVLIQIPKQLALSVVQRTTCKLTFSVRATKILTVASK